MKYCIFLLLVSTSTVICFAKDVQSITPPAVNEIDSTRQEKIDSNAKESKKPAKNSMLTDMLAMTTDFGLLSMEVNEVSYKTGGATSLIVEYMILPELSIFKNINVSARYMGLAASAKIDNIEYQGVAQGVFFGLTAQHRNLVENWMFNSSLEIGGFLQNFKSPSFVKSSKAPSDFLMGGLFGITGNYKLTEKFYFGPKLTLSLGSFQMRSLSVSTTFRI